MEGPCTTCFSAKHSFGDKRLDDRLYQTFNHMSRRPTGTLPQKLAGRARLVGGYRMFNNPKVTHQAILKAHQASCLERLKGYQDKACNVSSACNISSVSQVLKVLTLHDTTVLDYSGLDVEGLGQVGDGHGRGLYAHNSLMVIPATRQVVGLFNQILHKRAQAPKGELRKTRAERPDRESRLWTQAVAGLPAMPPGIQLIDVSDRGSDISEYLCHAVAAGRQFIVRSQHNRNLVDHLDPWGDPQIEKLHDHLRGLSPMGQYKLRVPAQEGGGSGGSGGSGGWREASMAIAFARVKVQPPRQARGQHGREPLELWGVIAREIGAPPGATPVKPAEPLEWILLTNQPVVSAQQAKEVVADYACRWMIEDYHKALKSGCGIEEMQMTTLHGLSNAIALLSVLGVHVLRLRCNARDQEIREQPARLHEDPLKVQLAARDAKHPDWKTMTVFAFYIAVARLGGYVLNPHKRPPGWIVLWRGYIRLEDMCEGVRLMGERCVQT